MKRLSRAIIILSLVASLFFLVGYSSINHVSAQTVTPSPTATATPTPTPTSTATVTPAPTTLPDSGVSAPTLLALGFGAVLLLISLSLAL